MADFYADFTNGNDTTGDGSSGNPYKTIGKIAGLTTGMGTTGNRIFVANTSAQVLASSISWSANWLGADATSNPCLMLPWNNGGSITLTMPNGVVIDPAFEIDGNDAVTILMTGMIGLVIYGGILHRTTSFVIDPNATSQMLVCCKIYDGGGIALVDDNLDFAIGCWLVGDATATQDGFQSVANLALGNFCDDLTGHGIVLMGGASAILNTVRNCDTGGIDLDADPGVIAMNTIVGNSVTNNYGVHLNAAGSDMALILDNIIQGHSGTGGHGIKITSGAVTPLILNNSYWNNSTNNDGTAQYDALNTTEADDPLTNAASGDFSPEVASDAYQNGLVIAASVTNRGADQTDNAAGVGGGGTVAYIANS